MRLLPSLRSHAGSLLVGSSPISCGAQKIQLSLASERVASLLPASRFLTRSPPKAQGWSYLSHRLLKQHSRVARRFGFSAIAVALLPLLLASSSENIKATDEDEEEKEEGETSSRPGTDSISGSMNSNTVVFSTPGCPYCIRAKASLRAQGIEYAEVDVSQLQHVRQALVQVTGRATVPVVFLRGKYIGGSDELEKMTPQQMSTLLQASPAPLPPALLDALQSPTSSAPALSQAPPIDNLMNDRTALRRLRLEQVAQLMGRRDGTGLPRATVRDEGAAQKDVFSGQEAVKWVLKNLPDITEEASAESLCQELQQARLLHHCSFSHQFLNRSDLFFRLHCDEPPLSDSLNADVAWLKPARPASQVAQTLRARTLELFERALSADGKSVSYSALRKSKEFERYVEATRELQGVDLLPLSPSESLSFWINVYNSLVIHAMVLGSSPSTFLSRLSFYKSNKYRIGGHDFSLDEIEHGVLRGNRPPPSSSLLGGTKKGGPFGPSDPRRFFSVVPLDPRIHFALNCGAKSCPPIKLYTPENLEEGLAGATAAFLGGEVIVNEPDKSVRMSKILDWYKGDFGETADERLGWIASRVAQDDTKAALQGLLAGGDYKIEYATYDWGVNE